MENPHPPGSAQHRRPIIIVFTINVGAVIISEAALSSLGFGLPDLGERLTNDGLDTPTQQCLRGVPIPRFIDSLLSGAVTVAAALPSTASSHAMRTYSTAAFPAAALT